MAKYKMTGNSSFKTAADVAKDWMMYYVRLQETAIQQNTDYLSNFIRDYSTTNKDLQSMQATVRKIKTDGPKLEDAYLTNKEGANDAPRDFTPYYTKGGIILGTLVLVSVLFMRD